LDNSPALSESFKELIKDPENTVFISAITLWEIWLRQSLGKLKLPPNLKSYQRWKHLRTLPL
jgi:PIN domain nuclease of toxin-antitoxin system